MKLLEQIWSLNFFPWFKDREWIYYNTIELLWLYKNNFTKAHEYKIKRYENLKDSLVKKEGNMFPVNCSRGDSETFEISADSLLRSILHEYSLMMLKMSEVAI